MVPRECIEAIGRDNCFLCYGRGHWLSNCPIYPGETPTSKQCPSCLAFHPSACKGVGTSTDAGLAPARNFIPGQMNYRNGYVNNNRYNNNNRQQMNGYNGNNNYNNRMGGGQRPYNNQNNNQNYQNRGPETMDKMVEVIEALVTIDPPDSKVINKDMTRIRTRINNLCSQLSRCQCPTR